MTNERMALSARIKINKRNLKEVQEELPLIRERLKWDEHNLALLSLREHMEKQEEIISIRLEQLANDLKRLQE